MPSAIERATQGAKAGSRAGRSASRSARTGRKETGSTTAAERRERAKKAAAKKAAADAAAAAAAAAAALPDVSAEDIESLKRSEALETIKKDITKGIQQRTDKDRVRRDRIQSGLMTDEEIKKALAAADKGQEPLTAKDIAKKLSKFTTPTTAAKGVFTSVKDNIAQQGRLLDSIQEDYGVDRATARQIADANDLTSTRRYNTEERRDIRDAQNRAAGAPGDGASGAPSGLKFSDYVDARQRGETPTASTVPTAPTAAQITGAATQPGDPNTMSFTFGGKPVTFQPRSVVGPQLKQQELDLQAQSNSALENFRQNQLEAAEPGYLDYAASIGSLVSSIWG